MALIRRTFFYFCLAPRLIHRRWQPYLRDNDNLLFKKIRDIPGTHYPDNSTDRFNPRGLERTFIHPRQEEVFNLHEQQDLLFSGNDKRFKKRRNGLWTSFQRTTHPTT